MGDRANVFFLDSNTEAKDLKGVFLYTHWGGYDLPLLVQKVLSRRQRWDDQPYLARMVFSKMVSEDSDSSGDSGFGISTSIRDNEHSIVVMDCDNERIGFLPYGQDGTNPSTWIPFAEFVSMSSSSIMELYGE